MGETLVQVFGTIICSLFKIPYLVEIFRESTKRLFHFIHPARPGTLFEFEKHYMTQHLIYFMAKKYSSRPHAWQRHFL